MKKLDKNQLEKHAGGWGGSGSASGAVSAGSDAIIQQGDKSSETLSYALGVAIANYFFGVTVR